MSVLTDLVEALKGYEKVVVVGPQRSGTKICGKILAEELGYEFLLETVFAIVGQKKCREQLRKEERQVLQAPNAFFWMEHLRWAVPKKTAFVFTLRAAGEIKASVDRIKWNNEGYQRQQLHSVYRVNPRGSWSWEVKRCVWLLEFHGREGFFEINYDDLAEHRYFVPAEERGTRNCDAEFSKKTSVWVIDCGWEGFRHDRLRDIWRAYEKYGEDDMALKVLHNPYAVYSHAQALGLIWMKEARSEARNCIITEFDFLPDFRYFLLTSLMGYATVASEYINGVGGPEQTTYSDIPGTWYMAFDKHTCERPDFSPGGKFNDPGGKLQADYLMMIEGCYPEHCGAEMAAGTHLFWQRHLHDDPDMVVGKERMRLGEMQEKHDGAVEKWLSEAPKEYRKIYNGNVKS